ncbi:MULTISPECIES: serine O-acetyltransferase EpsC [unclassified Undibacterium]|uniref:serine O-acetyltransferase EpsC n=1 Tax=unclassified Undibacterium TaxID=2630295 RepID=UPI002AC920DB|nr:MULTISPECIES: serine O-acetyltransferase EpsC [unclassified Undibacterium]MEB0140209.1 serine acetyltransferase [Undibacterium sp. CCC2.1]MEB0173252.1 serine acetyltransferase [Undibacterium sp. CCC1.1]MEB0177059.1 serine acetyltransferase [Undibacterium sp. CCC3.4]MEB0216360.1 serine acetyltransferase [Undibacterium sp. 5I2]WPX45213.1 serine O-acetyltransferase EpsC [Undibacterium sp. CCC3.4]
MTIAASDSHSTLKPAVTTARTSLFGIEQVVSELAAVRLAWRAGQRRFAEPGGRELPSREALGKIIADLCGALFPMRLGPPELRQESEDFYVGHTLDSVLHSLLSQVRLELVYAARYNKVHELHTEDRALSVVREFAAALPAIRVLLDSDVVAAYQGDPAARSVDEVLLCYPGVQAMIHHRVAHQLHGSGVPLLARIVAEISHGQTGIDIHPGAQIGAGFFIDHGTGVVIGETAVIGARVRIYQAVTLGAKRFPAAADGTLQKGLARHPVVEDDVIIYAGATVLGRVRLGHGCTIGGNVWVTQDVAAGSHVSQASLRHESPPYTE